MDFNIFFTYLEMDHEGPLQVHCLLKLFMVALCNRADHYIFAMVSIFLLFFLA